MPVGRDAVGENCHRVLYDEEEKCPWCVFDQLQQAQKMKALGALAYKPIVKAELAKAVRRVLDEAKSRSCG